jgi:hypothetical protein
VKSALSVAAFHLGCDSERNVLFLRQLRNKAQMKCRFAIFHLGPALLVIRLTGLSVSGDRCARMQDGDLIYLFLENRCASGCLRLR